MARERDNAMACEEAQAISFMYMKDDPCLTVRLREAFAAHLLMHPACASHYEESKGLMELLDGHLSVVEDTKSLLRATGYDAGGHGTPSAGEQSYRLVTVEEGWEDLKYRCPCLAETCRRYRSWYPQGLVLSKRSS